MSRNVQNKCYTQMTDSDDSQSESGNVSRGNDDESSSESVSNILSSDSDYEPDNDDDVEENAKKRKNLVKTNRQNSRLLQLYIKKEDWSNKFMDKIASKLKLSTV